ncbi:BDM_1a_G0026010.mRNA.1.CDS.1 [Saccharomyces cerevisiae]|nr:BDM_1a_G0026010.mRNA.1.CDS.1 [Saccharomyces cerevisiae]CAI7089053.1 BDM_1a_G0026010.mRNA.1.CDS.1 [Saccharomyces cerevisiae]
MKENELKNEKSRCIIRQTARIPKTVLPQDLFGNSLPGFMKLQVFSVSHLDAIMATT